MKKCVAQILGGRFFSLLVFYITSHIQSFCVKTTEIAVNKCKRKFPPLTLINQHNLDGLCPNFPTLTPPFFSSPGNRNSQMGRGGGGGNGAMDGDLSPTTTNQLARWFSPDLLERARGGELPSTATLAQVLSLEEIERQTAPPVHN